MRQRLTPEQRGALVAGLLIFLLAITAVLVAGCATRHPQPRPKYGDTVKPVGPSRHLYRNQPKFKP